MFHYSNPLTLLKYENLESVFVKNVEVSRYLRVVCVYARARTRNLTVILNLSSSLVFCSKDSCSDPRLPLQLFSVAFLPAFLSCNCGLAAVPTQHAHSSASPNPSPNVYALTRLQSLCFKNTILYVSKLPHHCVSQCGGMNETVPYRLGYLNV